MQARRVELSKYTQAGLAEMQAENENSVLIATLGKRAVGFCLSRYDDGVIWLSWFGVLSDCRRMGVGAALLEALERTVRRRKCHKIWCDTRTTNLPSQRLLKRVGFRRICKLAKHWYGQDFYLWEKFVR
jgi:ribosomal protein S18 acetylase RimI-like enzyme